MGIETIALIGLATASVVSGMSNARDEAKSVIEQGNIDAKSSGKRTVLKAAQQRSSFLNSGLLLEGTPLAAIDDTFNIGIQDIDQISSNANKKSKNIISSARTQALMTLATTAATVGGGSLFKGATTSTSGASGGLFSQTTTTQPSLFGGAGETVTNF